MGWIPTVLVLACVAIGCNVNDNSDVCRARFSVGLVTDNAQLDDRGFNASAWQGVKDAIADNTLCVEGGLLEPGADLDYKQTVQMFVDQQYEMVVTVGFLTQDAALAAAQDYPDIRFATVDVAFDNPPANLAGLTFREDQAGFLVGALAGMMTQSGTVAGVYGLEIPPVSRFRLGFENGAHHVRPDVAVLGVYQPSDDPMPFNNPDWGDARATEFIGQGADVIFGAGGATGNGALIAAARERKLCIGADVDQYDSLPEARSCLLSSAQKKVATAVRLAIEAAVQGEIAGGNLIFDAANGGVGLAPYHDHEDSISAETKAEIENITQRLAAGTLDTGYQP